MLLEKRKQSGLPSVKGPAESTAETVRAETTPLPRAGKNTFRNKLDLRK